MRKSKITFLACFIILLVLVNLTSVRAGTCLFTPISDILDTPQSYLSDYVSIKGYYYGWKKAPGRPPVTRSDWVVTDGKDAAIYCTGMMPQHLTPSANNMGKPISILAKVHIGHGERPYLEVQSVREEKLYVEKMVSVSQILFSPERMRNRRIGLIGVLVKGFDVTGARMYLLADPTGAIKLGRLPKLYPTGTILQIRGRILTDKNGLPIIQNVDILSAKVDLENFEIPEKYLK